MRRLCPKCQRTGNDVEVVEVDPKTQKKWLILKCGKCGYHHDLVEWLLGGVSLDIEEIARGWKYETKDYEDDKDGA